MKFKSWTLLFRNNQQIASETSLTSHYCYCWNVLSKDPSGSQKRNSREKQNCVFFCFILLSKINERKKEFILKKWCDVSVHEMRKGVDLLGWTFSYLIKRMPPVLWCEFNIFFSNHPFLHWLEFVCLFFPNYIFDVCISVFYRMHLSCARSLIFKHIYTLCTYASPYSN